MCGTVRMENNDNDKFHIGEIQRNIERESEWKIGLK